MSYEAQMSLPSMKPWDLVSLAKQSSHHPLPCATQGSGTPPPLSSTYFPKSLMIPLDFFLESGDGGDIWKGPVPCEPLGRDVPAKSRCSVVSFSVSAVPRIE